MSTTKDLSGKTFLVTGANTGIGKATVEALAARGAERIVIASRNREKTEPVLASIRSRGVDAQFIGLELGDLAAVRRAGDEVLAKDWTIDALINNAGIAGQQGLTKDGFELTFGTNHLGPYLFTEKVLPLVTRAPQGRIVNVSSDGHYRHRAYKPDQIFDWDAMRKPTAAFTALPEYFVSKLCNVLHAKELSRRLSSTKVTTYSLHPGGVASDIWERRMKIVKWITRPFLITNEEGARTQVKCATDPALAKETGLFYSEQRVKAPNPMANDVALQDELKRRCDEWIAPFMK
jgi:NAD(P)-dependent dehydrogenase (short-subunit alcohol dehydrogenase family)